MARTFWSGPSIFLRRTLYFMKLRVKGMWLVQLCEYVIGFALAMSAANSVNPTTLAVVAIAIIVNAAISNGSLAAFQVLTPRTHRVVGIGIAASAVVIAAVAPLKFFQFYVAPPTTAGGKGQMSCQLYQRSADIFLGVPFNIASYALLTHMVAQQCDLEVGDFIWTGGDCHIYSNHHEQVELQLTRSPFPAPTLHIKRRPESIFDYQFEDFEVRDYQCHPGIKAPVAV